MEHYNNELYHYGVKGMKWGVRRYQNEDGTLTDKGKKRLAKNEAYREKLVRKAQNNANRKKADAEEAEFNVKDLQKRGKNSKAYRDWKESEDQSREWEYEREHKMTDEKGNTYVKKYSTSGTRVMNEIFDHFEADDKVQDLIDENNKTARRSREAAKQWTSTKKDLMNMEVSALTKKRDIRRTYYNGY